MIRPNPLQRGQAPKGELNEKSEGEDCAKETPVTGDLRPSNREHKDFPLSLKRTISPLPSFKAVDTASAIRSRLSGRIIIFSNPISNSSSDQFVPSNSSIWQKELFSDART